MNRDQDPFSGSQTHFFGVHHVHCTWPIKTNNFLEIFSERTFYGQNFMTKDLKKMWDGPKSVFLLWIGTKIHFFSDSQTHFFGVDHHVHCTWFIKANNFFLNSFPPIFAPLTNFRNFQKKQEFFHEFVAYRFFKKTFVNSPLIFVAIRTR